MSLASLLSQLDARPDVRGREFERICAWYLRNAPEYSGLFSKVWLWAEWPGGWGDEAGIDLVAEEHDGRLWAIQAKAYDPSYYIKKSDVDSFLSESSRPQFSYRLLIATTDNLGRIARRTLYAQREPVGYLLRSQLQLADVAWPDSPDDLRPRRPPPKTPLPHVRSAIEATATGFADQERGQLIMACGTGKTLAAMWIAERLGSNRTLVLVPSLSLLTQTLREWCANASEPFEYLAVCSDPTVVGEDQLIEHTSELGFPATTDPRVIARFLRRRGRRVVFSTYQSSPQVAAAFGARMPLFDLAVADEAHRCVGRTSSEFATILDGGKIRSRRRLFMTATPRFYTPQVRREAGQLGVEVASMDNEQVFGPVLHRLSFGEAIERDLLSDYQVVVVGVDDEMYRSWAQRGEFVSPDGKSVTDARSLAGQIGLAKSMRKYDLRRIISFHSRVKAARKFSEELPFVSAWMPAHARPQGAMWSEHVSGAMTSGHRDRLLLRFRDLAPEERGLLSNARCLGEGVDVPSIDGIAFIDPRRSTVDIVQALGRAIRKSTDKRIGTIVLPVFLSATEDPDEALNESVFKHVWDVVKALRAHDEALGEELDELRRRLGARRGAVRRPEKIKLDVPRTVGAEFVSAFGVRLVEQTTASWEFYFGLLQSFVDREGHSRVPAGYRADDGFELGQWLAHQRRGYQRGTLDKARRRRLERLPGWTWTPLEDDWEDGFARLQSYVRQEGHSRVPALYRAGEDFRLGSWVANQRQGYQRATLDAERQRRLEALPEWTWTPLEDDWEDGFTHLQSYVQREGHTRVPAVYRAGEDFRLGQWVAVQRKAHQRGTLGEERRRRLAALPGWSWDLSSDAWEEAFTRLQSIVERKGHSRVHKRDRDDDGFQIDQWVQRQRRSYQRGTLDEERRQRLEALPGWTWDWSTDAWEDGFARLRRYVDREGHCQVPRHHRDDDGYQLGAWVGAQRRDRSGTLGEERRRRLTALPGWTWNPFDAAWQDGFVRLQRFVMREGHSQVPQAYRDDDEFRLGSWVTAQRQGYRRRTLDEERRRRLERLPGWAWNRIEAGWEHGFARLQRFVEREGHGQVPRRYRDDDGFSLGEWVQAQRRDRWGTLDEERRRRLEALRGWSWDPSADAWEDAFTLLKSFVEREGHSRVPRRYRGDGGFGLGQWVSHQRQGYQRGTLEDERRRRLEALAGWIWDPAEADWADGFACLQRFVDREGHSRVPGPYRTDEDFRLGQWVGVQRRGYQLGTLHQKRLQELEALPGWTWNPHDNAWEKGFTQLIKFAEREGHARVHRAHRENGFPLGSWVSTQRQAYRQGTIDEERVRRLESLFGWAWRAPKGPFRSPSIS
jgi:superfamily II DNA or RNA helicase